ncbi:MAG: glycosyltransferase [Vicinamibacterales bacterium]
MASHRIHRAGKFLVAGDDKFVPTGVSYGTFAPDAQGAQFPPLAQVAADFARMRDLGVNTVRVYTVPDQAILDQAAAAGLRLMVGLPWAQHIAFLDDARTLRDVRRAVVDGARAVADHPAVALVALGNEIPASVVRWHGQSRIEAFLRELYDDAKAAAPDTLFTYVNFPPTEYLELPFLDVCAFNVYLHDETKLRRYLARLQHVAGPLPLLIAEAGADSIREGLDGQAALTAMQLKAAYAAGACGAIAFAWTDEWWRGGHDVDDWAFGLVDRQRQPKPAAAAAARVFADAPFPREVQAAWPTVSVVVCAYNAADTLDDCLQSLTRLRYPSYEMIVVDDGSKDDTAAIAARYPQVRLISTPNHGLSTARNIGLAAATGAVVAYTDADVRADADWLGYLVQPFADPQVVAVGGPNVVPEDDPWVAQCVARAPGGPTHVLFDDRTAEHVPGCNMAMRRDALTAIGGFNPIYLRAGDDVDVCWRLQSAGGVIAFAPSALVWHHHRPSVGAFWRQQVGYGEGEVWLRPHHPDKFVGSKIHWRGHVYSPLPSIRALFETFVNTGQWGTAPFPSVYRTDASPIGYAPHAASWMVTAALLLVVGAVMFVVASASDLPTRADGFGAALALAGLLGLVATTGRALRLAWQTDIRALPTLPGRRPATSRLLARLLIAWLHVVQPLARARGRLRGALTSPEFELSHDRSVPTPSLQHLAGVLSFLAARGQALTFWSESWLSREALLSRVVERLRSTRVATALEIDATWHRVRDVSLQLGRWGRLDVQMLVEEHAGGKVLVRISRRLHVTPFCRTLVAGLAGLVGTLALTGAEGWMAGTLAVVVGLAIRASWHAAATIALADTVMARVLVEAGAMPLWTPATVGVAHAQAAVAAATSVAVPSTRHAH